MSELYIYRSLLQKVFNLEIGRHVPLTWCVSWFLNWNHPLHTLWCLCRYHIFLLPLATIAPTSSSHMVTPMFCLLPSSCCCYLAPLCLLPGHLPLSFVSASPLKVRACISFFKSFYILLSLSGKSSNTSCIRSCNVFFICFSKKLKSRRGHCSLTLALLSSKSSLDQSNWVVGGCGASNLQYVPSLCVLVHSHLGVGFIKLTFLKSIISSILHIYNAVLIGLNLFLQLDHLVVVFPEVHLCLGWGWVGK